MKEKTLFVVSNPIFVREAERSKFNPYQEEGIVNKKVTNEKMLNFERFCIGKDTRKGVLYAPFACVLVVGMVGLEPMTSCMSSMRSNQLSYTPVEKYSA